MSQTENSGMTRRTLLRRGGTAAVGAAAVGTGAHQLEISPVGNSEAALCGGVCIATTAVVGAGLVGYSLGRQSAPKPDVSAEQAEADWENWVTFYNRARQINTHDTSQLEQARRDANGMANLARRDAILAIYNEAVAGSDKSAAQTAAEESVNNAFSETVRGVYNHFASRLTEFEGDVQIIQSDDFATSIGNIMDSWEEVSESWHSGHSYSASHDTFNVSASLLPSTVADGYSNTDIELPNGESVTVPLRRVDQSDGSLSENQNEIRAIAFLDPRPSVRDWLDGNVNVSNTHGDPPGAITRPRIREPDPSLYDSVNEDEVDTSDFDGHQPYLEIEPFVEVLEEIETIRTNTLEEVEQLVDIHFEAAQNGNISLPEMTASQGLLEAARNADSFREIALTFRTMGWATADTATVISFEGEEAERVEVDSKLAWARQDQPDPLPVGSTVNAGDLPGTMYVAYNYEDENGETAATYNVVTGEMTIEATEDGSGEVGFEHRGVVDTSMDPDDVQDEFRETNDAEQDAEEARQDINVEGSSLFGGGFSFGDSGLSLPTLIGKIAGIPIWLIAVIAAYIYNSVTN